MMYRGFEDRYLQLHEFYNPLYKGSSDECDISRFRRDISLFKAGFETLGYAAQIPVPSLTLASVASFSDLGPYLLASDKKRYDPTLSFLLHPVHEVIRKGNIFLKAVSYDDKACGLSEVEGDLLISLPFRTGLNNVNLPDFTEEVLLSSLNQSISEIPSSLRHRVNVPKVEYLARSYNLISSFFTLLKECDFVFSQSRNEAEYTARIETLISANFGTTSDKMFKVNEKMNSFSSIMKTFLLSKWDEVSAIITNDCPFSNSPLLSAQIFIGPYTHKLLSMFSEQYALSVDLTAVEDPRQKMQVYVVAREGNKKPQAYKAKVCSANEIGGALTHGNVSFLSGKFEVLSGRDMRYLEKEKSTGRRVIVSLNDEDNGIVSLADRAELLSAVRFIDCIAIGDGGSFASSTPAFIYTQGSICEPQTASTQLPEESMRISDLVARLDELKSQGLKIVFTDGVFDIVHKEHIQYLEKAKEFGDILVVGTNSDRSVRELKGPSRPFHSAIDRATLLASLEAVDYVVIFDDLNTVNLISKLKPNVYFCISDGCNKFGLRNDREILSAHYQGACIVGTSRGKNMSTTEILYGLSNRR